MLNLSHALELYVGQTKTLSYGTAGFRENVALPLTSVFVKMGILVFHSISYVTSTLLINFQVIIFDLMNVNLHIHSTTDFRLP